MEYFNQFLTEILLNQLASFDDFLTIHLTMMTFTLVNLVLCRLNQISWYFPSKREVQGFSLHATSEFSREIPSLEKPS